MLNFSRVAHLLSPSSRENLSAAPAAIAPAAAPAVSPAAPPSVAAAAAPSLPPAIPPVVAAATALALQAALSDVSIYLPQERWFKLLQDKGREMTEIEAVTYPPNDCKVKTRNINHGRCFYPDLYKLAEEVFKLFDTKRDIHFQQLPKERQKTATIHAIGKTIASHRVFYLRNDLNNNKQGFDDFILSAKYAACDGFYILTQAALIDVILQRYGGDESQRRATTNDKIHVAGILITDEEMREYLPDLTGKS